MNEQEFTSQELIITIVCACIFVFGVLGNGLTIWVLLRSGRWRKNTTNMFIVSLTLVQDFDNSHFRALFLDTYLGLVTRVYANDHAKEGVEILLQ